MDSSDLQNAIIEIITINANQCNKDSSFEYIKSELSKRKINLSDDFLNENLESLLRKEVDWNGNILKPRGLVDYELQEDSTNAEESPFQKIYSLAKE